MKKKALIIEDNILVSETIKAMLEFYDFEVSLAQTGPEGIEEYKKASERGEKFDIVFVDLILPEMHGSMIINELKKIDPSINAVISSGFSEDPSIKNYESLGFKAVLNKPYNLDDLKILLIELGLI